MLLRGAKQLLTLRGPSGARRGAALHDLGIIEDGSVLIRDGVVAEVGTSRRIENLKEARQALEIPAYGCVVMPGFVDANLNISLVSAEADGAHRAGRRRSAHQFFEDTLALMRACLQHGTLAADLKARSGLSDPRSSLLVIRQLRKLGDNPVRMVRTWRVPNRSSEAVRSSEFQSVLATLIKRQSVDSLELAVEAARDLTPAELERLFSLAPEIAVNLCWAGESIDGLEYALAHLRPRAISCPSSFTAQASRVLCGSAATVVFSMRKEDFEGPSREQIHHRSLIDSGCAIALSSGYDAWRSPTFNMQMAVVLAVLRFNITIEEAIMAGTINAAYAAGCGHITGSLEVGKKADILLLNVPDYRELPRQFGINQVGMVIRDGTIAMNRTRWKAGAAR